MDDPAYEEVCALLHALADATGERTLADLEGRAHARVTPRSDLARWADSGAMSLTGAADGPPVAPAAPVASRLVAAGAVLQELGGCAVDAPALLAQRARLRGLGRRGAVSVGGGCRLLRTHDGWVAISINRPDDWELLPALFCAQASDWAAVEAAVSATSAPTLSDRAAALGLAVGVLPDGPQPDDEQYRSTPWVITPGGQRTRASHTHAWRVVDLSALWAGPLCASLLHTAGAEVTTVESPSRPDGARRGDPELHRLLHHGCTLASLDLRTTDGLAALHQMVMNADIVITAARPRALHQLDLDPFTWLERRPELTWVAITGYGLTGPWCNRIGYGDDTAVAGGLVIREPTPMFCADAIADPITGIYAAVAALAVASSGGGVIDIALREVAAHVARP